MSRIDGLSDLIENLTKKKPRALTIITSYNSLVLYSGIIIEVVKINC